MNEFRHRSAKSRDRSLLLLLLKARNNEASTQSFKSALGLLARVNACLKKGGRSLGSICSSLASPSGVDDAAGDDEIVVVVVVDDDDDDSEAAVAAAAAAPSAALTASLNASSISAVKAVDCGCCCCRSGGINACKMPFAAGATLPTCKTVIFSFFLVCVRTLKMPE